MTDQSSPSPAARVPGHVSIAPRVITRLSGAIVGEALDVDHRDVRVEAFDDSGRLGLHVSTPVTIRPLTAEIVPLHDGVLGAMRDLQGTVSRRLLQLADREVSRVDVTVTGSRLDAPSRGRVR
jgi:hypothetical protein